MPRQGHSALLIGGMAAVLFYVVGPAPQPLAQPAHPWAKGVVRPGQAPVA